MNYAIILAGGTGSRAGGPLPKQFQPVKGKRMLWWSIEAFRKFDPNCKIILVLHPYYLNKWDEMFGKEFRENFNDEFIPDKVSGGESRIASVKNALEFLKLLPSDETKESKVFIHDAARPFLTTDIILRGEQTANHNIGGVPVVPVTDSLRKITPEGSKSVIRSNYVAVQTPQVFIYEDIVMAYGLLETEEGITDDASVAERAGFSIKTFEGDPANIKITHPGDF